jgi:manganese/zinc/iron transport system permease protein
MSPLPDQGFFSFIVSLWVRAFLFLTGQIHPQELVIEDLQFWALILSGLIGLFLGFYLIYNKMTMVANSLSHTILLGLIVVFMGLKLINISIGIENIPFIYQLAASVFTAFITLISLNYLSKRVSLEAANAFSFTAFFALGILLSSVYLKNTHLGLESVLGNLEALNFIDIIRLLSALVIVVLFITLFKTRLSVSSFDQLFAKSLGVNTDNYRQALVLIASLCLMVCFRSLGVILILSLLTAPVLITRLFHADRKKIFLWGAVVVLVQTTLCLGLVHFLYIKFNLPVSTSGLFGFLGLVGYLLSLRIRTLISTFRTAK